MIYVSIGRQKEELAALEEAAKSAALLWPLVNGHKVNWQHRRLMIPGPLAESRTAFDDVLAEILQCVSMDDVTVLVSRVAPIRLNPFLTQGMESLIAMLILAFPEVRWLFGTICGYDTTNDEKAQTVNGKLDAFRDAHGLHRLFAPRQCALFDADGLRDWVRERASTDENTAGVSGYLPRRRQFSLALDEETPYSHLHAYTAYRFGFRAAPVNSGALADYLLGEHKRQIPLAMVFEDVYVNFADGRRGMSWLDFDPANGEGRSKHWPRLANTEHRIFVTSGQRISGDGPKWASNAAYFARLKDEGRHVEMLFKPYAGIFRLWEDAKLFQKLSWPDETHHVRRGVAAGFIWPPRESSFTNEEHGHSSPGVMLVIAESLIERAEQLLENGVYSVPDAVQGAVLANDALEILGGRTPTVAVEALRLKHQFEVLAECQFAGVEHHIRLEKRMQDTHRDVQAIARWFGPDQQEAASLNAEIHILTTLMRVFREAAQFDEEQECLREIRRLNRNLGRLQRNVLAKPVYWLRCYADFLLSSLRNFAGGIAGWVVLLTGLYYLAQPAHRTFVDALRATFSSFIGFQPPENDPSLVITMIAMLAGVAHLGIFISHLYTIVSRK